MSSGYIVAVAVDDQIQHHLANTRAVPLVRKDDAHQGRVFCFSANNGHRKVMI